MGLEYTKVPSIRYQAVYSLQDDRPAATHHPTHNHTLTKVHTTNLVEKKEKRKLEGKINTGT